MTRKPLGLRLKPAALRDLEDIWRYTAQTWSPDQADQYTDALTETIERLCVFPEMARERTEFAPPVRIHSSAEHLIVYHVMGETLEVLRVLGARQDWRAVLHLIDQ